VRQFGFSLDNHIEMQVNKTQNIPYEFCLEFLVIQGTNKKDNNNPCDILDDTQLREFQ